MSSPVRSIPSAASLRSPQLANAAAEELQQLPNLSRLYSDEELRILAEIV